MFSASPHSLQMKEPALRRNWCQWSCHPLESPLSRNQLLFTAFKQQPGLASVKTDKLHQWGPRPCYEQECIRIRVVLNWTAFLYNYLRVLGCQQAKIYATKRWWWLTTTILDFGFGPSPLWRRCSLLKCHLPPRRQGASSDRAHWPDAPSNGKEWSKKVFAMANLVLPFEKNTYGSHC